MKSIRTENIDQTFDFARKIGKDLKGGEVLALHGELGSGKTTFTQGLARTLGIKQHVISPTFLIIKQYTVEDHPGVRTLYHVDLYRLEDEIQVRDIGLKEMLEDDRGVVVIEWPERMGKLLPVDAKHFYFSFIEENTREILYEETN